MAQPGTYNRGVEQMLTSDRAPALAAAVAHRLNDELTLILGGLYSPLPQAEALAEVERAALRCAGLSRRLLAFAERHGGHFRTDSVHSLLQW
jgi:hypothetical protein